MCVELFILLYSCVLYTRVHFLCDFLFVFVMDDLICRKRRFVMLGVAGKGRVVCAEVAVLFVFIWFHVYLGGGGL